MKRVVALACSGLLAACQTAGADQYPSLAIRDAERVTGTLQPPPAYVPPPTPPAVTDRLAQLSAEVASAQQAFEAAAPRARSVVNAARGSDFGSEAWAVAQVAVAGLESTRSQAMIALADLDRLYVEAATQGGELTRIAAVRETAIARVEEQNRTINTLLEVLG